MKEYIIVSLTSYGHRINNLPYVFDTIYRQTIVPDKLVLNLAYEEVLSDYVSEYIDAHGIEVIRVPDTKVYKKIIPTLRKYPDACVINIDDDWLYPNQMIEEFVELHQSYPQYPISGNHVVLFGRQCHCGCASLTKREYFGELLDMIDDEVIAHCPSSDLVYTYIATLAGHPYIRTKNEYFTNMVSVDEGEAYSSQVGDSGIENTWEYLIHRFGKLGPRLSGYITDKFVLELLDDIYEKSVSQAQYEMARNIRSSWSYRIGKLLTRPLSFMRKSKGHK